MEPDLCRSENKLPDYHNGSKKTAATLYFRACGAFYNKHGISTAGFTSFFFTCLLKGVFSWQMHGDF